ncbi:MAG: RnfH family protein [Legionellales bacterium]|nr:RnfH family protein [Legionellales bacterium]
MVDLELVYAPAVGPICHVFLTVQVGSTVGDVVEQSGVLQSHPETRSLPVGIFSQQVSNTRKVRAGDRIEIYRPLLMDPKEKRRQRARS